MMSTLEEFSSGPSLALGPPVLPERPRRSQLRRGVISVVAIIVVAGVVYAWINTQGTFSGLISGFFGSKGVFRSVVAPGLPPAADAILSGLSASVTTFCIAFLSILFGIFWSLVMLPWSARNLAPGPVRYGIARGMQAFLRAIPELIMLLVFLITVGITPFASVLALTLHGTGVKGKLYAEAVEAMDMAPVEALRVAGVGRMQVFLHAVLPSVRTTLVGLTLYRLDANFRSAVALGAVGGGGIGFLIDNQMNTFLFKDVMTYLIIVVVWVLAIERLSEYLRSRL